MSTEAPKQDPKSMPLQGNVVWQKDRHFLGTAPLENKSISMAIKKPVQALWN